MESATNCTDQNNSSCQESQRSLLTEDELSPAIKQIVMLVLQAQLKTKNYYSQAKARQAGYQNECCTEKNPTG